MEHPVIYIIIAANVIAVIGWGIHIMRKRHRLWRDSAERLDFEFDSNLLLGGPAISGTRRGTPLTARGRTRGASSHGHDPTYYFVEITAQLQAPCWQNVEVTDRNFGLSGGLSKLLRTDDSNRKSTDDRFATQFGVDGDVSDRVRDCLQQPEVRKAIRQLAFAYQDFSIDDGAISITSKKRNFSTPGELQRRIDRVLDTAHLLDEAVEGTMGTPGLSADDTAPQDEASESLFPDPSSASARGEHRKTQYASNQW